MKHHHFRWLILFLLVATLLRLVLLDNKSLWFDEAFSTRYAGNPVTRIIAPGWQTPDPHPPLYYMGLHYWMGLMGDSETAVRLPSAILSLGSVVLLYLLGGHLFNPTIGLMAAGLLSVSPINIWYAQEARMYAAVTFLGLLAALLLSWDRWLALPLLGLTLAMGLYLDYSFIPLWMALSTAWFVWWWHSERERRPLVVWLLATICAVLLYLPWRSQFLLFLNSFNKFHILERLQEQISFPFLSATEILILLESGGAAGGLDGDGLGLASTAAPKSAVLADSAPHILLSTCYRLISIPSILHGEAVSTAWLALCHSRRCLGVDAAWKVAQTSLGWAAGTLIGSGAVCAASYSQR